VPSLMKSWRSVALFAALGCAGMVATVADVGMQKPAPAALEERRLIIRSGTLFTKDGVPINLSGFDSEIQTDKAPPGGAPVGPKQIRDVVVRSGRAFVHVQDLGKLIQTHIHNDKLTDVKVATSGTRLKLSGHLKKAIPVHFEITGPVSVTQTGLIDLHESSMKVDKIPMKGLSEMLGMDPGNVLGKDSPKELQANKEDILMDPSALWGMSVHGKLTEVKVVNDGLMLTYGAVPVPSKHKAKPAASIAGGK
jgi:hypothetical protein